MADIHYSGINLVIEFGGTTLGGFERTCTISETAAAPETIDVTHATDTERQTIEGLPGSPETNISVTMLDIYDAPFEFSTLALNTKDTLIIYPYGTAASSHAAAPMLTLQNARFHERGQDLDYGSETELSGTFNAKNTLTRGTYSSA